MRTMLLRAGRSRANTARLQRTPRVYLTAIGEPCDPVPPRIGDGE